MSDDVEVSGVENESKEADVSTPSSEYSETELAAIERGWNPEGVEGKRNLSAEEFLDRQKLYDDMRQLKRANKNLQKAFDALQGHHARVREVERKKLLEDLKVKKKIAYEADDVDAILEIDDQIADIKTEEKVNKNKEPVSNAVFETWAEENSWYMDDAELKVAADALGNGYMAAHPNADLEDALEHVTNKIKKLYPDKFEKKSATSSKQPPASVTPASRSGTKPKSAKYSEADMPEEDRKIMNTVLRSTKSITKEQYLKEYFEYAKA